MNIVLSDGDEVVGRAGRRRKAKNGEVLGDGEALRTPIMLTDGRAAPIPIPFADRRQDYALSPSAPAKTKALSDARRAAIAARDKYIADMCDAWRGPDN